jgi:hypothetical protein
LSNSAWNRLLGSALAARYSACCKARTLSPPTAARADLAETALTRSLPQRTHKRSSGPSLTAGCVVLRLERYYGRLRRPPGTPPTSRFHTGYRTALSALVRSTLRPGRASPVPAVTFQAFRALSRRGVPRGCTSRVFTASMAFAVNRPARLSLDI